jgi:hypothetical protein
VVAQALLAVTSCCIEPAITLARQVPYTLRTH